MSTVYMKNCGASLCNILYYIILVICIIFM